VILPAQYCNINCLEYGHLRICNQDDKCGHDVNSGRLEFQLANDIWGTVCEYGFHGKAASVACRQLGYQMGDVLNDLE